LTQIARTLDSDIIKLETCEQPDKPNVERKVALTIPFLRHSATPAAEAKHRSSQCCMCVRSCEIMNAHYRYDLLNRLDEHTQATLSAGWLEISELCHCEAGL